MRAALQLAATQRPPGEPPHETDAHAAIAALSLDAEAVGVATGELKGEGERAPVLSVGVAAAEGATNPALGLLLELGAPVELPLWEGVELEVLLLCAVWEGVESSVRLGVGVGTLLGVWEGRRGDLLGVAAPVGDGVDGGEGGPERVGEAEGVGVTPGTYWVSSAQCTSGSGQVNAPWNPLTLRVSPGTTHRTTTSGMPSWRLLTYTSKANFLPVLEDTLAANGKHTPL
jgi:hypothetical protein